MPENGDAEETSAAPSEDVAAETAANEQETEAPEDAAATDASDEETAEAEAADSDAAETEASEAEAPDGGDTQSEVPAGMAAALGLGAGDAADGDDEPAHTRRPRKPATSARKPRRSTAKVLSLFVLVLLIGGIAGAAFVFNQKIMMWMPATQRLYAMVGVKPHVLGQGLQIVEPTPKKEVDGNDEILVVEGEIRNTTANPIDIPLMRGALLDKQGKELHIWTFTAAKSKIEPGENARYRTEFRNPPVDAESLDITFTRANAVMEASKQDAKVEMKPEETSTDEAAKTH